MKLLLIRAVLFSCLLSVLLQCSSDQSKGIVPVQLSAKAIAADTSFLRIVTLTTDMRDVRYNNLRAAHSEPKRVAMSKRVSLLLSRNDKDSLVLAIKLLGFKDVNQYLVHLSQIASAKGQLAKSGIFLEKLPLPVLAEANRLASAKLNLKYPVIFARKPESAKPGAKLLSLGGTDVCTDCHFNNCDECNANPRDGEMAGDDTDGGGAIACRDRARAIRQSDINTATAEMAAELLGCGWSAGEVATGTTVMTIGTGPFAPVIGGGVGGIYLTGCAGLVIFAFSATLNKIEVTYQIALAGCPN